MGFVGGTEIAVAASAAVENEEEVQMESEDCLRAGSEWAEFDTQREMNRCSTVRFHRQLEEIQKREDVTFFSRLRVRLINENASIVCLSIE